MLDWKNLAMGERYSKHYYLKKQAGKNAAIIA